MIETGSPAQIFHDDPEFAAAEERGDVAGDKGGVTGGEQGDFGLDVEDVVFGGFEVDVFDGDDGASGEVEGAVDGAEGAACELVYLC